MMYLVVVIQLVQLGLLFLIFKKPGQTSSNVHSHDHSTLLAQMQSILDDHCDDHEKFQTGMDELLARKVHYKI